MHSASSSLARAPASSQPPATQLLQRLHRPCRAVSRRSASSRGAFPNDLTADGRGVKAPPQPASVTLAHYWNVVRRRIKLERLKLQLKAERDAAVARAAQHKAEVERLQQAEVICIAALDQSQADLKEVLEQLAAAGLDPNTRNASQGDMPKGTSTDQ
ncbi:hypothetical protein D9Q98_005933 [Chlorella vulgaris]|uniref:Uncharacterized protein n=1 Tax=Chlorella vulgaris TaxID=3077 RepID=A0A9D4Z0V7_CHLVU|nr:hypothetical protein D9Q98_005933 [Chlorella vulgaris]